MSNAISWFELPTTNFQRAMKFYGELLDAELQLIEMDGLQMGFFPAPDGGVGGAITHGDGNKPSAEGSLVYLNGGEDLSNILGRVEKAGGQIVMPKTSIGENGFFATFMDSEGNRVALHSMS